MLSEISSIVANRNSRSRNVSNSEVKEYREHLQSTNMNEAVHFSRDVAEKVQCIDTSSENNIHRNPDNLNSSSSSSRIHSNIRDIYVEGGEYHDDTVEYSSLRLFGEDLWRRSFNIYDTTASSVRNTSSSSFPSCSVLPSAVRRIYEKVGEMLQEAAARIPKLIIYLQVKDSGEGHGHGDDVENQRQGNELTIYCKCMLMANGILPDFRIQWLDRTKLRYSLKTGRLHIRGPTIGSFQWDGGMENLNLNEEGSSYTSDVRWAGASDKVKEYLLLSQDMMKRCIQKNRTASATFTNIRHDANAVTVEGGNGNNWRDGKCSHRNRNAEGVRVYFEQLSSIEMQAIQRGWQGRERCIEDRDIRRSIDEIKFAKGYPISQDLKVMGSDDDYEYADERDDDQEVDRGLSLMSQIVADDSSTHHRHRLPEEMRLEGGGTDEHIVQLENISMSVTPHNNPADIIYADSSESNLNPDYGLTLSVEQ